MYCLQYIIIVTDTGDPSNGAKLIFKEGIYLEVTVRAVDDYEMLRVVVNVPTSKHGDGYEGILGNFNGYSTDDLAPKGAVAYNPATATGDDLYAFGNSCKYRHPSPPVSDIGFLEPMMNAVLSS